MREVVGPGGAKAHTDASRHRPPMSSSPRKHVLLVEDEPGFRDVLQIGLEPAGFDTEPAGGLAEAIQILSEQSFDAIVSDLRLKDGSGIDLLTWMKEQGLETPGGHHDGLRHHGDHGPRPEPGGRGLPHQDQERHPGAHQGPQEPLRRVPAHLHLRDLEHRGSHRRGRDHPEDPGPGGQGGPGGHHRADHRGERHRQGGGGPAHPPLFGAVQGALRGRELRGPAREPAGIGALRLREGGLHGCHRGQARPLRGGPGRASCSWTRSGRCPCPSR